jgi:hypothetical protein
MKMHSQNLLYLVKQLGMIMILRNVVWFGMLKILAWLTFLETDNFLRSQTIRYDQQHKEKNARQIKNTSQSSGTLKKDKIKTVLALINEL